MHGHMKVKIHSESLHGLYLVKNDVAASRQEAFRADRHFSNASNILFEAQVVEKGISIHQNTQR